MASVFEGIYSGKQRQELIKKEFKRLSKSLKDLDDKRQVTLEKLFSEAAFMAATLEEARLIIIRDGIIEEYTNGQFQRGIKKSAAVEVYDKMVNTYCKIIDQINKSLPEAAPIDQSEEILKFALAGKR